MWLGKIPTITILLILFLWPGLGFSFSDEVLDIPKLTRAPEIDGVLDNPIWEKETLKIEDFHELSPKEIGDPSE